MDNTKQFNRETLLSNILAQKILNESSNVYYVGVYKESETGLVWNDRMLVIQEKKYSLFYTKYFKPYHRLIDLESKGTQTIKQRIFLLNPTISREQNKITIRFSTNTYEKHSWVFKFISDQLAEKWMFLFHQIQEKCVNKSTKTKQTKSTTSIISDYNSILSNVQKQAQFAKEKQVNEQDYYTESKKKKINISKMEEKSNNN